MPGFTEKWCEQACALPWDQGKTSMLFKSDRPTFPSRLVQLLCAALLVFPALAFAQATNSATVKWLDARELTIEGKGWADTVEFYDRLPARAKEIVRGPVWSLSRDSTGIAVRFTTDATAISVRWKLRKETLAMSHMPASGVSGVDLYVKDGKQWHWLGAGRAEKFPENEKVLVRTLTLGKRDYVLYLPLYNGVTEVQIGVPAEAELSPAAVRPEKPILFYGTSIVQGGCASRPGMAYPAILGRMLDRPAMNLGFSGNGQSEPEVAKLIAEIDAAAFVLDSLPNLQPEQVTERVGAFVKILRSAHPKTPIFLVEHVEYAEAKFVEGRRSKYAECNVRLRAIFKQLMKEGDKNLYYIPAENLLGTDGEGTVDGTHPTDLGFLRMAEAMEPLLKVRLKRR